MIRVLHVVSNMDRAGAETMLMNYYRHVDRTRVQFDFLCNKSKPGAYDEEILQMGGRIFHTPGLNPLKYGKYLKCMQKLLSENSYNVIEAHNGPLALYALHAAKKFNVPVRIMHAHGTQLTRDPKYILKWYCKKRIPFNITHRFSCGTEATAFYFGSEHAKEGDFEYVRNAINLPKFVFDKNTRSQMRAQYNLTDKHVVGHVGRFMHQKNHEFLIRAFSELRKTDEKAYLVLLGDGELMETVKDQVKALGIQDSVMFVGNVSNVNQWYQAFDSFVLPSFFEGLPVVGIEAQASGLRCTFSDTITKETDISGFCTFLSLQSPLSEWAKAISESMQGDDRPDMTQVIGNAHYDIDLEAKRLQEIYIKLDGREA